jgi:hypothetical protein
MQATLAAFLLLEVLDGVGDVELLAAKAGQLRRTVQQPPGRPARRRDVRSGPHGRQAAHHTAARSHLPDPHRRPSG